VASIQNTTELFFVACETGKGWAGCSAYCRLKSSFYAQVNGLAGIVTLEACTEWRTGLFTTFLDASYEIRLWKLRKKKLTS